MTHAHIRTGAVLLILAIGESCTSDPGAARSEPPPTPFADASIEDVDAGATTTSEAKEEPPTVPEAAPVEFTACVGPGPSVTPGPEENVTASLPDGETTLTQRRGGYTWQSTVNGVSDPRLEGTWYNSVDKDEYTRSGGVGGPNFYAVTHRVESDEGAWQGSLLEMGFSDGDSVSGPIVLTGEGAYEGLTAVATINFGGFCPNTRGYIIEGGVPAPPVPQTGQ